MVEGRVMKKFLIILAVAIGAVGSAQKDTREILDAANISVIDIHTNEVFLINIISSTTSSIRINTHAEGEYFNQIILETNIENNRLAIKTKYPERLTGGFDKLSAHKVFSLEIEIAIPEGMEVNVRSNIASLQTQGEFKSIFAELKQGYCKLQDFAGTAIINTFSGNILVETSSGLLDASSRNGRIDVPDFLPGRKPIRLRSIDGDIKVLKN
jgi:DUF4097 and DUF4098 domain-containing protein YvlB